MPAASTQSENKMLLLSSFRAHRCCITKNCKKQCWKGIWIAYFHYFFADFLELRGWIPSLKSKFKILNWTDWTTRRYTVIKRLIADCRVRSQSTIASKTPAWNQASLALILLTAWHRTLAHVPLFGCSVWALKLIERFISLYQLMYSVRTRCWHQLILCDALKIWLFKNPSSFGGRKFLFAICQVFIFA